MLTIWLRYFNRKVYIVVFAYIILVVEMMDRKDVRKCPRCKGEGVVREEYEGEVVVDDCPDCDGEGWVE